MPTITGQQIEGHDEFFKWLPTGYATWDSDPEGTEMSRTILVYVDERIADPLRLESGETMPEDGYYVVQWDGDAEVTALYYGTDGDTAAAEYTDLTGDQS